MKKRILSMLLVIVMVLGMLPTITLTADAAEAVSSSNLASLDFQSVVTPSNTFKFVIKTMDNCNATEANCNDSYVQINFEGNHENIYLNESLMHNVGNTKEASITKSILPCSATLYLADGILSSRTYKCEVSAYWNGHLIGTVSLSQKGGGNTYAEGFAYKEGSAAFPQIGDARIEMVTTNQNLIAKADGTKQTAYFSIHAKTNYGHDAYAGRPITVTDGSITKDNIGGRVLKNTVRTVNTSNQDITIPGVSLHVEKYSRYVEVDSSTFIKNYNGTSVQFKVAADLCMYAGDYQWGDPKTVYSSEIITLSKPTYTVRFHANDGSGSMNSQTLYYGNDSNRAALPQNAFTRAGYTFAGWNTQSDGGGTAYADKASVLNLTTGSSITLFAQWTANEYTATLDSTKPSGATGTVTGGQGTATVTYNATPGTVTTPSLPGYTFGGYYDGANGSGTQYFNANGTGASTWDKPKDATLYAKWTANKYNIAFNEEGGSTVSDVKATYDSNTYATVDVSTREGYTFQGWFTRQSGGQQVYDKTGRCVKGNEYWNSDGEWIYLGNVTLYAQWTPNDYTLSYNTMGGAPLEDQTVTFDSPYIGETPERIGYIFDGWYQEEGYVNKITIGSTPVKTASDHFIFAKWKPITYKIYYANGTNTVKVQNATYGTKFNLPLASTLNLVAPANHHFVGWNNLSADATTVVYADGQPITTGLTTINNGTVNLYAVWAENDTYRVIYNPNGGSGSPKDNKAYYEGESVTVKFTAPTRPGYQFLGWAADADAATAAYTNTSGGTTSFAMGDDDVTLYAVWKPIQYTVKYDTGVTATIADQDCIYDKNAVVNNGSTLSKDNYTFKGWAIKAGSDVVTYAPGEKVLNLTNENGETIKLYAVWQENPKFRVFYDANGGTGAPEDTAEYYVGKPVTLSADKPTRVGYTFVGWNTDSKADTALASLTMGDSNEILYAVWKANTYTVSYNGNGGSGTIADQICTYDTVATLSDGSDFTRTGYTFQGWALSAGGNVAYAGGVSVLNLRNTGGTIELYAVWQADPVTVIFDGNGGTPSVDNYSYLYGQTYGMLPNAVREGYTFAGWYTAAEDGTEVKKTDAVTAPATLYAHWAAANVGYTVCHYKQAQDGSYFLTETERVNGNTGAETAATAKTYDGYTAQTITQQTVKADGSTVVNVYYNLNAFAEYPVVFLPNEGGTGTAPAVSGNFAVNDVIELPANTFTKTGYVFLGWNSNANASFGLKGKYTITTADVANKINNGDPAVETIPFYAIWTESDHVTYRVEHYLQNADGSWPDDAHVAEEKVGTTGAWVDAIPKDYTGYTLDPTAADTLARAQVAADGSLVLKLFYTRNVYNVQLVANGGTIATGKDVTSYTYSVGATLPTAAEMTKTGYTFGGWFSNASCEGTALTEISAEATGDMILYAKWIENGNTNYTVEHYLQNTDGTWPAAPYETDALTAATGATVTATAKTYTGFTFSNDVNGTVDTGVVAADGSLVLKLFYTRNSYNVNLVTGGGVIQAGQNVTEYTYGVEQALPTTVTLSGYTFAGWYTTADYQGEAVTKIDNTETGAKTFYAKWIKNTFDVIYKANNGTDAAVTAAVKYGIGDDIELPATTDFTKTGYTFVGWSTNANEVAGDIGDYTLESSDLTDGKFTFYAIWVKSDSTGYKVEHYLQNTDGSYPTTADVTEDLYGTTGEYVEATAKTFVGFTYDSTVAGTVVGGSIAENGSLTLKLYYTRNSYTVSFVPNGGTVNGNLNGYVYGVGADLPTAEKTGFTFGGWFETPDLDGTAVTEITVNDTGDKLYYAKWTENTNTTYTVEHHKEDLYGGYSLAATENLRGTTDAYTQAAAKTYTGFTAQPIEQVKIDADGTTKVIVYYDRNSYQLVFDANGGTGSTSEQMLYETPIVAPVVTREDWTFTGWTPAVAATMPAENTTYTASWTQDTYTITYDANGGSGSAEQTPYVSVLPTLHNGEGFARDGWTLVGWSTAPGENNAVDYALGQTLDTAPVEKGQTFCLYAVWVQNMVTVTFDPNGGVVSPETMVYAENSTYQNMPIPERDDYTFTGWFTADDVQIANGTTLISDDDHTLYAHWATDTYTIVYHANGGNEADKTVRYERNGTPTLEGKIFTKANYDHVGWSAAENGAIDYELGVVLEADLAAKGETIHLYAVWGIADVVVQGYTGVYDGEDHAISYSLANQITVTDYQWYFKPTGGTAYVPVEDTDEDPCTYPVRDVAESGTYYCHIDGLEDDYYVVSFNTEETTVAISRRPISVTANNGEKVYDGLPLTEGGCTFTPNGTDMGICIGHTTEVAMTEESSITNVGQTPNVIDTVKIFDAEGIDVTVNYSITKLPGTLKVTPRDVALTPVEETLNVLYGTEVSDVNALLLSRYTVSSATPLGYGDEMGDLSISFEYSVDGENFAPLTDAALRELYRNNTETFTIRPIVNSGNYNRIDAEHAEITATVVKTTLWAKVKWYGGSNYTNRLSLTFYNASYDNAAQAWVVDESKPVYLPNGEMPEYEIRNYKTGEVLRSGVMTKIGNRYWANFDQIRVQAQVFFTADGYIIRSY